MVPLSRHSEPAIEVLARRETDPTGLSDDEAARRLTRFGPNRLIPPRATSPIKLLGDQFKTHGVDGLVMASVKGAPRQVLALADRVLHADTEQPLDERRRRELLDINEGRPDVSEWVVIAGQSIKLW